MKKYSYHGSQMASKIISEMTGFAAILFFSAFAIALFSGIPRVIVRYESLLNDPRLTLVCVAVWFLLIAWMVGSVFINFLPTIWITEKGLQISAFIFFRIQILWSEIIDVGEGRPPKGYILVRARKITPFHRLYGWLYSRSFYPSFLIGKGIKERDNLISEIRERVQRPL